MRRKIARHLMGLRAGLDLWNERRFAWRQPLVAAADVELDEDTAAFTLRDTSTFDLMFAMPSIAPSNGVSRHCPMCALAVTREAATDLPAAIAPSTVDFALLRTSGILSSIPIATFKIRGRFVSRAAANLAAASRSFVPLILTATKAGVQLRFAFALASQLALHSAETFGGTTFPEQTGALRSTEHLPRQVPSHLAPPFISQLPLHWPAQLPLAPVPHLPWHVPAQLALLVFLLSQVPSQVPLHFPEKSASHEPLHVPGQAAAPVNVQVPIQSPSHVPESSPPSQVASTLAPFRLASHLLAQSETTPSDTEHTGGLISSSMATFAPSFALASSKAFRAAAQASFPVLKAVLLPKSLASPPQPATKSASTSAAISLSAPAAMTPALT